VTDSNNENQDFLVSYLGDDSIVIHAVAPQAFQITKQGMTKTLGTFATAPYASITIFGALLPAPLPLS
jgi:hypothetical protein